MHLAEYLANIKHFYIDIAIWKLITEYPESPNIMKNNEAPNTNSFISFASHRCLLRNKLYLVLVSYSLANNHKPSGLK